MNKIALITGATSGIGKAITLKLASQGYDVIFTGRRNERLSDLQKEVKTTFKVRALPLSFDVRDYNEVVKMLNSLPEDWSKIDVLVNNAGLAVGLNPINQGVVEDWERMIDTNIKGLLYVTRTVSPGMVERKKGHIINIGSIAGKEVYTNGNVYCATKHAVDALNKGMRMDLLPHNIRVTQVCPGAVDTEFSVVRFKGDKTKADQVYKGFCPILADDIANAVCYAVTQPANVDIQDILVMPTAQASATVFHREESTK